MVLQSSWVIILEASTFYFNALYFDADVVISSQSTLIDSKGSSEEDFGFCASFLSKSRTSRVVCEILCVVEDSGTWLSKFLGFCLLFCVMSPGDDGQFFKCWSPVLVRRLSGKDKFLIRRDGISLHSSSNLSSTTGTLESVEASDSSNLS